MFSSESGLDEPRKAQELKILMLTLVFSPDGVSTANLLTELSKGLVRLGHEFTVMTTTPHYNREEKALAAQPLHSVWAGVLFQSSIDNISIYHARVKAKGTRILSRLKDYVVFHVVSLLASLWRGGKYDVVLAPSPPLTVGLVATLLARYRGVPFVYNVQEIYPDIAVSLGVLKNRWVIRLLEAVEGFIYRRAHAVVVISERFKNRLLAKGVPARKLHVIHNFVDLDIITPRARDNEFSRTQGVWDKFVVLYAGNIGLTQDFETLLDAAARLQDVPQILFMIIGDGARREWLAGKIAASQSTNVRLFPYQPASVVPDMYASSSLCIVPMVKDSARDTFPSKIYTIMAAGRAGLVCADADSELSWVVQEAQSGVALPPGRPELVADAVRRFFHSPDELRAMGVKGRTYVVAHHSSESVARQYDALLRRLTNR